MYSAITYMPMGGIGFAMASKMIEMVGTTEQANEWLPRIQNYTILTSYSQTELGHGSDVQNLQTLATFDKDTQEFVVHTPNVADTKWWPGDLGIYSTHTCLFARLIIEGNDYGVQPFFCRVRDHSSHRPLPGVEIGDIGPKLGYNGKDNGFIRFNKFRIPKSSHLSRYVKIDSEGGVSFEGNPKVMYVGMMKMRTAIVGVSYYNLLKASLITLRYSIKRKQFMDTEGREIPIFEYSMQKEKIYTQLSRALVLNSAFITLIDEVDDNDKRARKGDFTRLKTIHLDLCGHKVLSSEWNTYGVQNLIRACGGHGYNMYSGLPLMFKKDFPSMILEGENSVLCLQISRDLLKCYKKMKKGKTDFLVGARAYFKRDLSDFDLPETKADFCDLNKILDLFKHSTLKNTAILYEALTNDVATGGGDMKDLMNNKYGSKMWELGKLQATVSVMINAFQGQKSLGFTPLRDVYNVVSTYFSLDMIEVNIKLLASSGSIKDEQM